MRAVWMLAFAAAVAIAGASPAAAQQATTTTPTRTTTTTHRVRRSHMSSQARLRREAKISERAARETALKEVPGGRVRSAEIERENGKLIWSFDIAQSGKSGVEEVHVDAMDGSVLSHTHESPREERHEQRTESHK